MTEAWVDANVLLRLVTDEPKEMAEAAAALAARASSGEITLRLAVLVVAEMTWVLRSYYKFPAARVADILTKLVTADGIAAEEESLVIGALEDMGRTGVDFADAFLAQNAASTGLPVCSFDADFDALGVPWMTPQAL